MRSFFSSLEMFKSSVFVLFLVAAVLSTATPPILHRTPSYLNHLRTLSEEIRSIINSDIQKIPILYIDKEHIKPYNETVQIMFTKYLLLGETHWIELIKKHQMQPSKRQIAECMSYSMYAAGLSDALIYIDPTTILTALEEPSVSFFKHLVQQL